MSRSAHILITVCWLQLLALPALSGQTPGAPGTGVSPDSFSVEASPVIVRAAYTRLPFTVSQIGQAELRDLREPTLEPLLNTIPGVWMQTGALNTNRISIRGVGYREPFATSGIKVYLDEIPLTNGAGEAGIEDIHPQLYAGVRVWRGPGSAIWGAGLGGMIHLQSRKPEDNAYSASLQVGSFGRFRANQQIDLVGEGRHRMGLSAHYQFLHDDGFRQNNDYRRHSISLLPVWSNRKGLRVQGLFHWIDLRAFIPSSITREAFESDPRSAAPTWLAVRGREEYGKWIGGLHWQYAPGAQWAYSGSLFATGFDSDEVRPFNVLEESSHVLGTRHRVSWSPASRAHLSGGMEYYRERYANMTFEALPGGERGNFLGQEAEQRTAVQVFAQGEYHPSDRWVLLAGVNIPFSGIRSAGEHTQIPVSVFPMAGISYLVDRTWAVTAQTSRGYSALSAADVRSADGSFDESLRPESGWNHEVSLRMGQPGRAWLGIGVYTMTIQNTLLTRRIQDDVFEKFNGGTTRHTGPEIEYQLGHPEATWQFQGSYTFAAHSFLTFPDAAGDFSGNRLPGIPRHQVYNRVEVGYKNLPRLRLEHQWLRDIWLDDANTVADRGYSVVHAGLSQTIGVGEHWDAGIRFDLHNALNTRYASMFQLNAPGALPRYYYPAKPRAIYLTLSLMPKAKK